MKQAHIIPPTRRIVKPPLTAADGKKTQENGIICGMQETINDGKTVAGDGKGVILVDSGTSPAVLTETVWTQMEKGVLDNAV